MRIAFLTTEYATDHQTEGGLGNYLAKLCELLRDMGHEPVVFLLGRNNRRCSFAGIPVVEVRTPWLPHWFFPGPLWRLREAVRHWCAADRLARFLWRDHREKPFDVVQAANWRAVGVKVALKRRLPLVVRLSFYAPLRRQAEDMPTHSGDRLTDLLERIEMRRADRVFGPSRLQIDILREREGIEGCVIRTPFHLPRCGENDRLYKEVLTGVRYFLYFGKLNRLKGVADMAEALPAVLAAEPQLHAVFLGRDTPRPGGGTYGEYLLRMAAPHTHRVHVLGPQPRSVLLPILRNAEFVVLPSRVDNYPNTCLEAQAVGKIVIGTYNSSLDEMIEDGTGFLCRPACPNELGQTILRAARLSPEEKRRMEAEVSRLALERDPCKDVEAHLALYREAIRLFEKRRSRI